MELATGYNDGILINNNLLLREAGDYWCNLKGNWNIYVWNIIANRFFSDNKSYIASQFDLIEVIPIKYKSNTKPMRWSSMTEGRLNHLTILKLK
jgi:hypothetical protein